jgi:virginiamycin A acetyltransferase
LYEPGGVAFDTAPVIVAALNPSEGSAKEGPVSDTFLNPAVRFPVCLPDGSAVEGLVHLDQVIAHPNWSIGAHSYFSSFDPVSDYAAHLAPRLYPGAPERIVLGRFCALAHGVRFITSSANHPMEGFPLIP